MNVQYEPELRKQGELFQLAQARTSELELVLDYGAADVVAAWKLQLDGGGPPAAKLTLSWLRDEPLVGTKVAP
jgi:hypothetical protein